jgi:MFS family permease
MSDATAQMQFTAITQDSTAAVGRRAIVAIVIGNWLEFFDFTTFALFAVWIGRTFFPAQEASTQLLLAVGTFGAGFLLRPLGALVLGRYADRRGSGSALALTIALMGLGTAMIALTPGYATIGIAAPVMIVLARMIQGFSSGGEMGAATSALLEAAPHGHRGRWGSWQYASQGLATLTASLIAFALSLSLSEQAMAQWGWRIPFFIGLVITPIGIVIRRALPAHESEPDAAAAPFWQVMAGHRRLLACGLFALSGAAVGAYVIGHYMTSYAINTLHLSASVGIFATVVSGVTILFGSLASGWLMDRYGRKPVMVYPRLALVLLVLPAFWALSAAPGTTMLVVVVLTTTLLQALSGAAILVALPECFPRSIRSSSLALVYAAGAAIFGGTSQLVVTWLLNATGNPVSPAWYLLATSSVTLLATLKLDPPHPDAAI